MSKQNKKELSEKELKGAAGGFSPPLSSYDQVSDGETSPGRPLGTDPLVEPASPDETNKHSPTKPNKPVI